MSVAWGVIGCGGIAYRRTIPEGILPAEGSSLLAVMDTSPRHSQEVAQKYHIHHHFMDINELLAVKEIQAVYIATPNYLHKEQVICAARAGKHILVEKPIALNTADAEEMINICNENGVKLMVGYMMRFHAHHQHVKKMIEQGDLGQVIFGRTQLTCWYPPIPGAWRQDPALGGGGAWIDLGSHCIDLLEMWLGPVTRISAFSRTLTHDYPVDDSTTVLCEFQGGTQGIVEVNFNVPDDAAQNSFEIRGTRGIIIADHTIGQGSGGNVTAYLFDQTNYSAVQERNKTVGINPIIVNPINPYRAEIEHFNYCIKNNLQPENDGEHGLHNLKLIQAGYESARTGKAIEI